MELLIGLALILGLWEFREYRNEKKREQENEKLNRFQQELWARMEGLLAEVRKQGCMTESQVQELAGLKVLAVKNADDLMEARNFIQSADANLQTIMKEYELRMRRQDEREPDFIEGL